MKLMCKNPNHKIMVRNPYLVNVLKINITYFKQKLNSKKSTEYREFISKDKDLLDRFNHRARRRTLKLTQDAFFNFINAIFIYNEHRKEIKPNIIKGTRKLKKFESSLKTAYQALIYHVAWTRLNVDYLEVNNIDGVKNISDDVFQQIKRWFNKAYLYGYYAPKSNISKTVDNGIFNTQITVNQTYNIKRASKQNLLIKGDPFKEFQKYTSEQLNDYKKSLINDYRNVLNVLK